MEAARELLNKRWGAGGPWEVRRVHKDGILAIATWSEGAKMGAGARVVVAGGSIFRVQSWNLERGTYFGLNLGQIPVCSVMPLR